MKLLKFLATSAVAVFALSFVKPAQAGPVLDAGWFYDQINPAETGGPSNPSVSSPYVFTLGGSAVFSITDAFIVGDTYKVYDSGSLILSTSVGAGAAFAPSVLYPSADTAWKSGLYSIGSIWLGAGAHTITIAGDGVGGLPAGFYDRLDHVPDSSATLGLIGLGLMAIVAVRRRLS